MTLEMEILKFTCCHKVFRVNLSRVSCSIRKNYSNWNVGHEDSLCAIATMVRSVVTVPNGLWIVVWCNNDLHLAIEKNPSLPSLRTHNKIENIIFGLNL